MATSLIVPLLVTATPRPAHAATPGASPPWIDTSDRAAVLDAYRAEFDRAEPAADFTGDVAGCVAGTTSTAFRQSVVQRINWYRRMAGLGIVSDRADYNSTTQQSALIMAANGSLSHNPDPTWACYSAPGATVASKSNLALGTFGIASIDAYIRDSGANNLAMGHRRTILYPQLLEVGTGDIPAGAGGRTSNVLRVFDSNLWSARPAVRQPEGFVAWPPPGYVPPQAVWGRWTFSLFGGDFSSAVVSVSNGAGPVTTTVLARRQSSSPTGRIAPEPTIVWSIGADKSSALLPAPTSGDECYDIRISGVTVGGDVQPDFVYSTCVIDPSFAPSSIPTGGSKTPIAGAGPCVNTVFAAWVKPCWSNTATGSGFGDVTRAWQSGPVEWLVTNQITTGVSPGRFDPDSALTRAQAATMIWRLAGTPTAPDTAPSFADVPAATWYHDAVRWMAAAGITTGTGQGRFSPRATATRAELVTFLWRLIDSPIVSGADAFSDLSAQWQRASVGWAASTGITTGTTTSTFAPDRPVSRGEAAVFLARFATLLSW